MCTLCDVLEISNRVHELVRQLKPFSTVTCGTKHLDKGVVLVESMDNLGDEDLFRVVWYGPRSFLS